jgi:GT2 family glycosyltransferase
MADSCPAVAVVILNWNGKLFLEKFLPSVSRSSYPNLKIYLADNASTDDSIAFVRQNFPGITIIRNPENTGFAAGYNQALQQITADYYVLLNQDVAVETNWIWPVIRLMESDPSTGACQPKILSFRQQDHFEYAGAAGGWIDRWGYTFCRGRIFDTLEKDTGQYDRPEHIFWASGAALFIRASLYHQAGGLDKHFFAHMEEIDLCWRLQRLGYRIQCCPQSVVYHVGGGSLPRGNQRKAFLNFRNNLIMLHKNLQGAEKYYTIFIRLLLDGIAGLKSLINGNAGETGAILKAHYAYYSWLLNERAADKTSKKEIPARRFKALPGVYRRSLVWQYFIHKRKTFSSLKIQDK